LRPCFALGEDEDHVGFVCGLSLTKDNDEREKDAVEIFHGFGASGGAGGAAGSRFFACSMSRAFSFSSLVIFFGFFSAGAAMF
jgi:hypothetical protein